MKFSDEKKNSIKQYLLERITSNDSSPTKTVAETCNINLSTVHSYIKELISDNIIRKIKRGQYELVSQNYTYTLSRKNGDLQDDMYALAHCLSPHISHLAQNVQDIWSYVFSEMINNVMDHSAAEIAKIIIIQDYLKTEVVIFDNGVGIFEKIKDHFNFNTLDDAICELFKGKLTTDTENHSGEGIFFSSKLMDSFFIFSSGKIFTNNKFDDSIIMDMKFQEQTGTCVMMELSNFSHKTTKEVFDSFANEDGNFIKTRLPLKNIFDSSPVSRSQAKRISNRLEKFKEVIIDFDEITWMGQGFAHQLFVLFPKNHPEISITPINMNEDITKMYNHVLHSAEN